MADPGTSPALARHNARMKRARTIYVSAITVVVLVIGVLVVVAWTRGETYNTTLKTVASAPSSLPLGQPGPSVRQRWGADGRAAIGSPQWRGTVVVSGDHTVRGLDARTGEQTWSYTRSNRSLCTAAQLAGTTVAVYRVNGNCDQVTGLDSGTGERRWTRTLDMDAMPVNGTPVFSTAAQGDFTTLLVRTSAVIYAIDPNSGYNRWTYTRYGCAITGAVLGSGGALISQRCGNALVCQDKVKFCGRGPQLLLRNGYDGRDEGDSEQSKANPDRITWNLLGVTATPVSADGLVSAVSGRTLTHYDQDTGTVDARTTLAAAPTSPPTAVGIGNLEIVDVDGTVYGVTAGTATPTWRASSATAPTVVGPVAAEQPTPTTARLTVTDGPDNTDVRSLDPATGAGAGTTALPAAPAAGALVYPLGTGYLVAGPDRTIAYA
ncbi:PQQ-binding-like beta-propeller repeat protein [Jatrophihabitans fulvus]